MDLVKVENLKLSYGKKIVLQGLNFEINDGDFLCIVGPNGSGKTTLVRSILGLIEPAAGRIVISGTSRKFIGYMPQETAVDPNFPASVFEIVLSGALNESGCFYRKATKERALEALDKLNIKDLKEKCFSELSGGQRQKVLLARALLATRKLLILDEPSNNLDQKSKESLYKLVSELNKKQGITIAMITHDLDHGNLIGDKILSLRDGDYFFGSTEDFVRKVHHE